MSSTFNHSPTNGRRSRDGSSGDYDDDDDENLSKRKKVKEEDTKESDYDIISNWDKVKQDYADADADVDFDVDADADADADGDNDGDGDNNGDDEDDIEDDDPLTIDIGTIIAKDVGNNITSYGIVVEENHKKVDNRWFVEYRYKDKEEDHSTRSETVFIDNDSILLAYNYFRNLSDKGKEIGYAMFGLMEFDVVFDNTDVLGFTYHNDIIIGKIVVQSSKSDHVNVDDILVSIDGENVLGVEFDQFVKILERHNKEPDIIIRFRRKKIATTIKAGKAKAKPGDENIVAPEERETAEEKERSRSIGRGMTDKSDNDNDNRRDQASNRKNANDNANANANANDDNDNDNDDDDEKSSTETTENNNSCVVGWREKLPDSKSSKFPKKFLDVLIMMDLLLVKEEKGSVDSFSEELYHHKRHGNRKGICTRQYLRKLKQKGDPRLQWHKPKKEWSPNTSEDLVSFVEVLHEISNTVFV
jgi:hypothetical protein